MSIQKITFIHINIQSIPKGENLQEMILIPISDNLPCGSDTKYDDSFISIETEIDKINSLIEGSITDWKLVSELSRHLLCEHTKDIKIASWWAYAQYKLNEFEGLESAFQTLNALMEHFGSSLFPLSNRVKINALQWFESALSSHLIQERRLMVPLHQSEHFLELLKKFQITAQSMTQNDTLFFKEAIHALEVEQKSREESAKKIITPPTPTDGSGGELSSDADAIKMLNTIKKNTEVLSRYWRNKEMSDLRSIRLTRMICWLEIDGLPESQNGKTMLNPPSLERIEEAENCVNSGNSAEALEIYETILLRSPFWLDGHFKVHQLLESEQHTQAALEVKNMLVGFIRSNDKISDLEFRDGTPFVSSELKSWINETISREGTHTLSGGDNENEKYEQVKESSIAFLKKKDATGAMDLLQRSYRNGADKEEQFKWRLLHAEIAVEALKPKMAIALIEELEKDISHFRLEEWQPRLAAQVYKLLLTSFNRTQLDHSRLESAYQGLCRVDSAEAVDIKF